MFQLVQGLAYLHSKRILHRDLKSQNILLDPSTVVAKIADFGLARTFSLPSRAYTHEVVTLWYRAPEILMGMETYSCAIDVWSLGCIFAELTSGCPPFRGDSEIDQMLKIFEVLGTPTAAVWPGVQDLPFDIDQCPQWQAKSLRTIMHVPDPQALDLLGKMLHYDPRKRISAADAIHHPFFSNLKSDVPDRTLQPTTLANRNHTCLPGVTLCSHKN